MQRTRPKYPPYCNARQRRKIRRLGLRHVHPKNGRDIGRAYMLDLTVRQALKDIDIDTAVREAMFGPLGTMSVGLGA